MNKKLIALAVSSALTAPIVMADDSGPTLYGRVNLAIGVNDSGDDTTTDVADVVSRFGIKGEEDLGNGLAAVYKYEFRVNADRGSIRADVDAQRLSYVGLKGGFGQVLIGTIWGTWYNTVGTHLDPTYTLGYFGYSNYAGGDYRIESALQYSGNFGPLTVSADLQIDSRKAGDDNIDRWIVGAKYNAGPMTFGVAYDEEKLAQNIGTDDAPILTEGDDTHSRVAAVANYAGDGYDINLGWMNSDDEGSGTDRDYWTINGGVNVGESNRLYLQYWDGSGDDGDFDADGVVLGFYHSLSSRTKLYFEGATGDSGRAENEDADVYLFGLRHDF